MSELQKACAVVVDELKKHGDFYDAFVTSVRSVIEEIPTDVDVFEYEHEIAEDIVKRISGEEISHVYCVNRRTGGTD